MSSSFDVSVVTPTGDRPQALCLLRRWISRQTFVGGIQWVVVDDGEIPFDPVGDPMHGKYYYVRLDPIQGSSVGRNLMAGIRHSEAPVIVVMEDDEWYSERHVEMLAMPIIDGNCALSGQSCRRNYQIKDRRWQETKGMPYSSLARTAFRARDVVDSIEVAAHKKPGGVGLDILLWQEFPGFLQPTFTSVGMKQMPGRKGAGSGHRKSYKNQDTGFKKLQSWIGEDVQFYEEFARVHR